MIHVLIVDDHHLFAEGIKSIFRPDDGIEVISHVTNGNAIPSVLESMTIDLILLDIDMPVIDGIACLDMLKNKGYTTPVLMLTMHQSMRQVKAALEKGARGYILKDASKAELVEAIITTSGGKNYFHPKISEQIFNYFRGGTAKTAAQELTTREKEIIRCLADGKNTKAISNTLFISEHTVKTHRRNIMYKLEVKTSAELIKFAMDNDLL